MGGIDLDEDEAPGQASSMPPHAEFRISIRGLPFEMVETVQRGTSGALVAMLVELRLKLEGDTDDSGVRLILGDGCRQQQSQWLAHHLAEEVAGQEAITVTVLGRGLGGGAKDPLLVAQRLFAEHGVETAKVQERVAEFAKKIGGQSRMQKIGDMNDKDA